jgi:hypothetical protein
MRISRLNSFFGESLILTSNKSIAYFMNVIYNNLNILLQVVLVFEDNNCGSRGNRY